MTDDGTCARDYDLDEPPIKGGEGRSADEVCTYGARIAWLGVAMLAAVAATGLWLLWGAL